ncbi:MULTISPECIES: hypothetical protein [Streptomyces]|uniref:hypothetical protein n=1 Tax=Streptomyces TaxID=1883 RepID=UPI001F15EC41|nr:hypothetical protein [Streptomyces violaceoruber]MCF3171186.1 hypothetical protein [Streptomyces violaceoruber]
MKRALVGLTGPVCYDYKNHLDIPSGRFPNPVLENVTGLVLSYDEIWFLCRELCPSDLQNAHFVKFVEDDPLLMERATVALEQFRNLAHEIPEREAIRQEEIAGNEMGRAIERIAQAVPFDFTPDHHSRQITTFRTSGYMFSASGLRFENIVADVGIAAALDFNVDVIFNSYASGAAGLIEEDSQVEQRLVLAEQITAIYTLDHLGPQGAFHESLNDLRSHERIVEFRKLLVETEIEGKDLKALAAEVAVQADRHARDVLDRFIKGKGKLRTFGVPTAAAIVNHVIPGAGAALGGLFGAKDWLDDREVKKRVSWAPFVLDARNPRK